jgi:hypothetical protein
MKMTDKFVFAAVVATLLASGCVPISDPVQPAQQETMSAASYEPTSMRVAPGAGDGAVFEYY